jgi:hypothetical protein
MKLIIDDLMQHRALPPLQQEDIPTLELEKIQATTGYSEAEVAPM